MNRSLLFILLLCSSVSLSAQLTQMPSSVSEQVAPSTFEIKSGVIYTLVNEISEPVYWKFERGPGFNTAWEFFVCDLFTCYSSSVEACPPNRGNVFKMDGNLFEYHFRPHGVQGSGIMIVTLYADKNYTQVLHTTTINYNVTEGVSSTKDVNGLNNLKVYPNPATDYFQISNAVGVKKIVVYNMFGKEVKSYFHYPNAQHEIAELKTGMYIVKLLNDKNKVIKSVKLNKNYSGV